MYISGLGLKSPGLRCPSTKITTLETNKRNKKSELITAVKIDIIVRKIDRQFCSSVI